MVACPIAPPEAASSLLHVAGPNSVSGAGDPFANTIAAPKARGCAACAPGSPKHKGGEQMALKLTLAELENWMRGKAENAARRELAELRNHVDYQLQNHMKLYVHRRKPKEK